MPRAPLLTGKNRNFKWVGVTSIPLFPTFVNAVKFHRASFYLRPDLLRDKRFYVMAEEVGFEPTGHIKADTTDFKSVRLCPLAHSSI